MSSENIKQGNPLAEEKIGRLIARFAVPAIISMLVSSLYNIVDQIFIGQGVGMLGGDQYCFSGIYYMYSYGTSAGNRKCIEL